MKKTLLFTLLTIALILTGCTQEPVKTQPASEKTEKLESEVTFKLINRETKNPIANQEVYICDDSVELKYTGQYPFTRFCDEEIRTVHKKVTTDSSGLIKLDIEKIGINKAHTNIIFDIGNSNDQFGIAEVERSDTLSHQYNPSYLRVVNLEESGKVFSNKFYNLKTNMVREIFISDNSEKEYNFSVVELAIFIKE